MNKEQTYTQIHWLEDDGFGMLTDSKCCKCDKPVGLLDDSITEKRSDGTVRYYHKECNND